MTPDRSDGVSQGQKGGVIMGYRKKSRRKGKSKKGGYRSAKVMRGGIRL